MEIKSNKIYIDYLDYEVSRHDNIIKPSIRLRFDLLLFSQEVLCMSVPACVKLRNTTKLLMELTPFWKAGKIKLILDQKHNSNPWNYFNNRNRILEKNLSENQLFHHFEYTAYHSTHTKLFYDLFIKETIEDKNNFFIPKICDTDEMFKQAVISRTSYTFNDICSRSILPVNQSIHMGKIFNDLIIIAEDKNILFQRNTVEKNLIDIHHANKLEIDIIRRILDKSFAYANGISGYAAPISQICNRLTGASMIPILMAADKELYQLICNLSWNALYRLSVNEMWLDLINNLNQLMLIYRDCKRNHQGILTSNIIGMSITTMNLIVKLYETAITSLQQGLLKDGIPLIDVIRIKEYSEAWFEEYLRNKHKYWEVIAKINTLLPAIKVYVRSLLHEFRDETKMLEEQGFIITTNAEV